MSPAKTERQSESGGGGAGVTGNQVRASSRQQREQTRTSGQVDEAEMTKRAKNNKRWHRRFKFLFCCLGLQKNKDSIADVASLFANLYGDNFNVFSTDIAAGFVLLSKHQAAQRKWIVNNPESEVEKFLSLIPITPHTKFLDLSTAADSHLINDLIYYMNYSLAIFGWPLHLLENPCMLCCVCPYLRPSRCCGSGKVRVQPVEEAKKKGKKAKQQKTEEKKEEAGDAREKEATKEEKPNKRPVDNQAPIILGDNCFGCNVASVENRLAAHNYEIIYVSYKDNLSVVPFLVVADHSKRSIVVALRGSMSPSDMVTDLDCLAEKLPMEDCPDDWLSHKGMNRAALYVRTLLTKEHILDRAFNCSPELGSQEYTLILTGHSLGAGVAAILGILMRKQYPTLRAFLYSPPGGCMTLPAVEYTKQFATGIILGNDFIPRLGVAQLERLRYYTLLSLKSSQLSSSHILAKAIFPNFCLGGNKVDYDPELSLNVLYGKEGRAFQYNNGRIVYQIQFPMLYVPGRLIHIVKNHAFKSRARRLFNEPIYQAIWTENSDYDRVMVCESILSDHLPHNVMHAMKMLFCKTLPARKESSDAPLSSNKSTTTAPTAQPARKEPSKAHQEALSKTKQEVVIDDDINNNESYISQYDENNNEAIKSISEYPSLDSISIELGRCESKQEMTSDHLISKTHGHESQASKMYVDMNGNEEHVSNKNLS